MSQPVLKVRGLKTFYRTRLKENVYSVDGVDLDLYEGRVLGIAGESGCGKSTLSLSLMAHYFQPLNHGSGSIEIDERVEDAAKRELFEETGLIAKELALFGVWSGPELHYVYPNGDEVSNIDIVFLCRKFSGTLRPQQSEVEALRFFAIEEVPENLSPPIRPALEKWMEQKRREQR